MKSKILKVVVILSCICVVIFSVAVPASADNVPYDVYRITKTDGTNVDYTPSGYGYNGVNSLFYELNSPQKSCYLYINIPDIFVAGSVVTISYTVIIPNTIKEFSFFFGGQQFVPTLSNFTGDGSSYTVSASFTKTFKQYTEGVTLYIAYVDQTSSTVGPFGIQRIHLENSKDEAAIQQGQTDQIIANQDKNFDKLFDGDGSGGSYARPDASGTIDGLGGASDSLSDATSDALGGKTSADLDAELGVLFDSMKLGDFTNPYGFSLFIEVIISSLGDYFFVIFISLTLGLSAFIIGRRY